MRLRDAAADVPRYMTEGAAGMDLRAALERPVRIEAGSRTLVPCGFAVAIPSGYEGQIRPRSGLALRSGLWIPNAPGTIDADYRGEVAVILGNTGPAAVVIEPGERIAQLVVCPVARVDWDEVDALDGTGRGSGGFGHTS